MNLLSELGRWAADLFRVFIFPISVLRRCVEMPVSWAYNLLFLLLLTLIDFGLAALMLPAEVFLQLISLSGILWLTFCPIAGIGAFMLVQRHGSADALLTGAVRIAGVNIVLFALAGLFAGLVSVHYLSVMDSKFGQEFFTPTGSIDPMLTQHTLWWLGHPEFAIVFSSVIGALLTFVYTIILARFVLDTSWLGAVVAGLVGSLAIYGGVVLIIGLVTAYDAFLLISSPYFFAPEFRN